ncbi:MAG: hypothetical protein IT265_05680 [Saprospiraceae bacterium]|nr:hypothetical protein [Saprospiraceae bacterium]
MKNLFDQPNILNHPILDMLLTKIVSVDFEKCVNTKREGLISDCEKLKSRLSNPDISPEDIAIVHEQISKNEKLIKQLSVTKVTLNHYYVVGIDYIVEIAKANQRDICVYQNDIYLFNGMYWESQNIDHFKKFLSLASLKLGIELYIAKDYKFIKDLFNQFISSNYIVQQSPDPNKILVNLKNGTLEITNNGTKLREFDKSDFLTYQLDYNFDETAEAPIFNSFLNQVLPESDKRRVLSEFIGSVFIKNGGKSFSVEKTLLLYGTGSNGKSVFFKIIHALLGINNTTNYSLESLTDKNGCYRAEIAGKLLNYSSEISNKMDIAIFKQLVSGEPVMARKLYCNPFMLYEYAKLIFNCNQLPKDVEHNKAFFRRFIIIHFGITIEDKDQDKELHIKIIDHELSGVFNWVLKGLRSFIENKGFYDSPSVKLMLEQFETESDTVRQFIDENNYQKSLKETILIKALYDDYKSFCLEIGSRSLSKTNFINRLKNAGYVIKRENSGNKVNLHKSNSI